VAVAWAAFGDPEVADPQFVVQDEILEQLQVDGDGRAYFASMDDVPVGDRTDRQMVVYERCGTSWQVDVRHGLTDQPSYSTRPISLEVAPSGDMLAVWLDGTSSEQTIYTSFRPAGGDWGATQSVEEVALGPLFSDIAPNGDAVLAYQENVVGAPLEVAVRAKASGQWATQDLAVVSGPRHVAMSPAGDAIVLTSDGAMLHSFFRPAGGSWGSKQKVADVTSDTVPTAIAFAPDGKAVLAVGMSPNVDPDRVMSAVRSPGAAGTWSALEDRSVVQNSAGGIGAIDAATHPNGVVLGWIERQAGAQLDDLGVARFNGTSFEPRKLYSVDNAFIDLSVGASPSGTAIVAAQHDPTAGTFRILVGEADGIAGAWPATLDEVPAQTGDHRDPRVGAGGIDAIAYGVHAGNDDRTEVVADGPSPACGSATPTPTASATATATATATPQPIPPAPPSIADPPFDRVAPKGKLQKVAFKGGKVRITLRLDERADVTFKIDGKSLAKRNLKPGTRKLALKPKRKLKRGRHRLTAAAVDAAGNRSKRLAMRFRVR
jgi:hypothetical protein